MFTTQNLTHRSEFELDVGELILEGSVIVSLVPYDLLHAHGELLQVFVRVLQCRIQLQQRALSGLRSLYDVCPTTCFTFRTSYCLVPYYVKSAITPILTLKAFYPQAELCQTCQETNYSFDRKWAHVIE